MAVMGRFDVSQVELLRDNLCNVTQHDIDTFFRDCAKELTQRLLRKAVQKTPVGVYPSSSGKAGGTLRRGWTDCLNSFSINHSGDMYIVELSNDVEYASYVEYGHRTRDHAGWVEGKFMMTISEREIQDSAPSILNRKFERFLRSVFTV